MFTWQIMSSLFKNPNQSKDPVVVMKEIISWLFKDPINSGLAQFDHANQTVKNGLKAKNIRLPQFFILIKKFLSTNHCCHFHWSIGPLHCVKFKKILPVDPELCGCAIFGPKIAHFPKWEFFFRKPVNEPYFFYLCLSTWQKSKPDINLLVKYRWLKNT